MEAELAEFKSKMSSSTENVTVTNNIPFDEEKNTDNMAAYASLYLRETTLMY